MSVKMIVTDLDNTLLHRDKTISEYTRSIFRRLRERNILTAFATSRSAKASARFRAMLPPDINITSGGAIAVMNGRTLFRAAIDIETATLILRSLKANEEVLQITADSENYYFDSKPVDTSWAGCVDYADSITTDFSEPLPVPDVFKITPNAISAEAKVINHHFKWWFVNSPPKGFFTYSPERRVSQALLLATSKKRLPHCLLFLILLIVP